MRTKQGTDFVSLLYAKQILMQKYIIIYTQFLGRAEGSFQDGRSRIKYFAISNTINDMKTTLILNRAYEKLPSAKNILRDFRYIQICYCTFGGTSKSQNLKVTSNSAGTVIKLPRRVYSRNTETSVSNDGNIPVFVFVSFLFLSSVIRFDKKCANSTQRSQSPNS